MSEKSAHLPLWVRCRDGSQVPFDADRICQSLFAGAESLGSASPFLIRELTDVVLHFLAQETWDGIPHTTEITEHVVKIVREVGQPQLAKRYSELQRQRATLVQPNVRKLAVRYDSEPGAFVRECLRTYALEATYSRDVSASIRERLVQINDFDTPASLASFLVKSARLVEMPWWLALDDWRACGGGPWTIESPEWLCCHPMHPAMTPHVCERLLSLPTLADRAIELHLNTADPPPWSHANEGSPLFASGEDEAAQQERANFLDGLLERWKALDVVNVPTLAWHIHEHIFRDETQHRQLQTLVRLASLGKPIRFIFDRPRKPIFFSAGLDRKTPGVLLEIGLDLAAFAHRADIANDGATLLKKLPSLARIAVSAANQKRQALRTLPEASPLKQRFLIERASSVVVPNEIDAVVYAITGASLFRSPLSLQFALDLLGVLREALQQAGRSANLDVRVECPAQSRVDRDFANQKKQLEIEGQLHARAGAGTATLLCGQDTDAKLDDLLAVLRHTLDATTVMRLRFQRTATIVQQGVLPIAQYFATEVNGVSRLDTRFANGWTHAEARAAMMLDPTVANLNTGSFGPLPKVVFERATELRHRLAAEPMDFLIREMPTHLWRARTALAEFLHADPRRLIFTPNVSASINMVASGLPLAAPGEILMTDHEYGAMHWCWERAAQRLGLTIRTFKLPILAREPHEIVDAACAALTPRTRLFFFSHVLSPTGLVLPAKELCAEARRRGILTVVDGAHAPAMVPLALDDIAADFYGANCHKWLLAPTGSGFLYFGKGSEDRLQPVQVSWGWRPDRSKLDERDEFGSTPRIRFYEFEGTRDLCSWLAVLSAIEFQRALNFETIRTHNSRLAQLVRGTFSRFARLTLATPTHAQLHGYLTAFRMPPDANGPHWRATLWERYRIEAPIVERPEGLLLRVSTHFYNTEEEIGRIAEAVEYLLR